MRIIRKRNELDSQQEKEAFDKKFGAIFDEFDDEKQENFYFYPLFFMRRFLIVVVIFVIPDAIVKLILSFILSLTVNYNQNLIYLSTTRCFKSKINNLLHILNEALTAFLHIVLLISMIHPQNKLKSNSTETCIKIITASWALNIFCSITKFSSIGIEKFKKLREKRRIKNKSDIVQISETEKNNESKRVFNRVTQ